MIFLVKEELFYFQAVKKNTKETFTKDTDRYQNRYFFAGEKPIAETFFLFSIFFGQIFDNHNHIV